MPENEATLEPTAVDCMIGIGNTSVGDEIVFKAVAAEYTVEMAIRCVPQAQERFSMLQNHFHAGRRIDHNDMFGALNFCIEVCTARERDPRTRGDMRIEFRAVGAYEQRVFTKDYFRIRKYSLDVAYQLKEGRIGRME